MAENADSIAMSFDSAKWTFISRNSCSILSNVRFDKSFSEFVRDRDCRRMIWPIQRRSHHIHALPTNRPTAIDLLLAEPNSASIARIEKLIPPLQNQKGRPSSRAGLSNLVAGAGFPFAANAAQLLLPLIATRASLRPRVNLLARRFKSLANASKMKKGPTRGPFIHFGSGGRI